MERLHQVQQEYSQASFWAMFDANNAPFSEPSQEKHEYIHTKIVEMTNVLLFKGAKNEGLSVIGNPKVVQLLIGMSQEIDGKKYIKFLDRQWEIIANPIVAEDLLIIDSSIGPAVLVISNLTF